VEQTAVPLPNLRLSWRAALEFTPACSVGDLLLQRLDALEQQAEEKGGVLQTLADQFTKVCTAPVELWLAA
jgi:hypothetical protein